MTLGSEIALARFAQHLDHALPAAEAADLDQHLAACAECRRAFDETARIVEELSALPAEAAAVSDAALDSALARIRLEGATTRPALRSAWAGAWLRRPAWRAAAAACLIAAGALAWFAIPRAPDGPHVALIEAGGGKGFDLGPVNGPVPAKDAAATGTVRVEVAWPGADRPAAGAKIEILRDGRVIASGNVLGFGKEGRLTARVDVRDFEVVERWDEVRVGR